MLKKFKEWCGSNTALCKCTRTIFQGVIGVIIANIDLILGMFYIDPVMKPFIVALVMAVLSPIQAAFGDMSLPETEVME